jgi:hypothetical protein
MAGDQVPGVGFGSYEPVVLTAGPLTGALGAVAALVSLTPGPLYTVEIGGGQAMSTCWKPSWRRREVWCDLLVFGGPLCS